MDRWFKMFPSGITWKEVETEKSKTTSGYELSNKKLSEALKDQSKFTQEEWAAFGIKDLRMSDCIKAGDKYFKPAYRLGYHFTSEESIQLILSEVSQGLRASPGGQLNGGVSICKTPPHKFAWDPFTDGKFRALVGAALWGRRRRISCLEGKTMTRLTFDCGHD